MQRYPEQLQFRVPPGTVIAVETVAKAEGKASAEFLREAVEARLATAGVQVGATMWGGN